MSTEKLQLYKCEVCGNLVQVILNGAGELTCCNQPMTLQVPQHDKTEIGEKHAPKIEFRDNKKFVQVISHPMQLEHYIQFIEVLDKDNKEVHIKYLHPEETPEIDVSYTSENIEAIEYCNIHGLWGEDKND